MSKPTAGQWAARLAEFPGANELQFWNIVKSGYDPAFAFIVVTRDIR